MPARLSAQVSGLALGFFSDRYGRQQVVRVAICLEVLAGFGQAFSPSIQWFWFTRFLLGVASYGRFLCGYVLMTEWIGPRVRARAVCAHQYGGMLGSFLLPLSFYLIPDYKVVQSLVSSLELLSFLPYVYFVWESPRWLLTQGRFTEASSLLMTAAQAKGRLTQAEISRRINRLKDHVDKEVLGASNEDSKEQTIFDVWKIPSLLRISLILYYTWFTQVRLVVAAKRANVCCCR